MRNDSVVSSTIQTEAILDERIEHADTSPPPSPPPIHSLYFDATPLAQGTNPIQPITHLPTRSNKASLANTGRTRKHQPLLLPKSTDLPPVGMNSDDEKPDGNQLSKIQQGVIYALKQLLMNRKNLILLINGLHKVWRARLFLARTTRLIYTYPYRQVYTYYGAIAVQLYKFIVQKQQRTVIVDMAQRQNTKLASVTLGTLFFWAQMSTVVVWSRLMGISRLGLKIGYRMLRFFGAWDSLALAFISVALTRSLQRPP